MNSKLRSLVVAVAVLTVGGVVTVLNVPNSGVTRADLIDAGIGTDCVKRARTCLRYSADGTDCPDGGPYCEFQVAVMVCPEADGGRSVITTRANLRGIVDDGVWCGATGTGATALAADSTAPSPFSCACSSGSNCTQTSDGGAALTGVTLPAGTFSGAGCVAKPCVELFGVSSWPAGCPQ